MAERPRPQNKRRPAKAASATVPAPPVASEPSPAARIRTLETERDRLQAELAAANKRIAALEVARDQVLDRIDWVIDSLHSLSDETSDSGC